MPRQTKAEREAAEAADRQKAEADLAVIAAFEQEEGRPPTKDELAERRAARATADADRELEASMGGHRDGDAAAPNGNGGSGSITERAGEGPQVDEDEEGQTFFYMGEEVTLATLLKRVKKVGHAWKFTGQRQTGKGSLPKVDGDIYTIVRSTVGGYNIVPTRDDQEKAESVVIEVKIEPKVIHHAVTEDGQQMMASLLREAGWSVEPPVAAESAAG